MNQDRHKRKLSAIFSADAVGYSRLMEADEAWTIKSLEENKSLISNLIEDYHGRVVDAPGDNILAEFSSVTNAIECAVKIQQELKAKNSRLKEEHQMEFRIGINLGEIVEDDGRIYGSGVNIAARIEGLSKAGGICISGRTYDHIKTKFDFGYEYLGEHNVKNISEPVRVYNVLMKSSPGAVIHKVRSEYVSSAGAKKSSTFTDKTSIVVLPFVNISGDSEQEYFSDGMTEEIINALANVEGLKVISRTSSFFFKGKDVDLRTIGEKLNVDNVLEGSVRKAGNKIRITAQLIKVTDDAHLWSETYDRELEDVFVIQDEISRSIVNSLKIRLLGKEKETLAKTYTENIEAYEAYIKGRYYFQSFMEGGMEKALYYYNQAITLDPGYAEAYSALAEYYLIIPASGQKKLNKEEIKAYQEETRKAINTALEIDDNLPEAHANLGLIKFYHEFDLKGSEKAFITAISLNPGLSKPHYDYSLYLATKGKTDQSILEAKKAIGLDPLSSIPYNNLGSGLCHSGQFEQALQAFLQSREMGPGYLNLYRNIVSTYIMLERFEEAMDEINKGLKLFPENLDLRCIKGRINALTGEKDKARKILDELIVKSKNEFVASTFIVLLCADLGEMDKALEYIEDAYDTREPSFIAARMFFPSYFKNDPRIVAIYKKAGL